MANKSINQALIKELEKITKPQDLIKELIQRFGDRAAILTSGQLTGGVMLDMAIQAGVKPRVATIDTERLFKETYTLFDEIEKHYNLKIEHVKPDPDKLKDMLKRHGKHLFFDSKEMQELCCYIRKVEPNNRILDTLDVWVTGLRADQSPARANIPRLEIIKNSKDMRPILKVSLLIDWTEAQVREYSEKNNVPTHKLLDWNKDGWHYESLGCIVCTTPTSPTEPRRAGRWRWFNKTESNKECGIHLASGDGDGI